MIDHERQVLYHLLHDHRVLSEVCDQLRPEAFTDPLNRGLYQLVQLGAFSRGVHPYTVDTLIDAVERRQGDVARRKEVVDRVLALAEYADSGRSDLFHSVQELSRQWRRQRMIEAVGRCLNRLQQDSEVDAAQELAHMLDQIEEREDSVFRNLGSTAIRALRRYDEVATRKEPPGIPSGFGRIDEITGGGHRRHLWIHGAYVSEGKTHTAKELAYHVALNGGRVLYISLEMDDVDVEIGLHARHAYNLGHKLEPRKISDGKLSPSERQVYEQVVKDFEQRLPGLELWVTGDVTMPQIRRKVAALQVQGPLDLVVVDYLQLVKDHLDRWRPRQEVLGSILRDTKRLAHTENVWTLGLYQMKREGRDLAEKRGHFIMSDLAETTEAERNADVVTWSLYTGEMEALNEIRFGCCKNRHGPKLSEGYMLYAGFKYGVMAERVAEVTGAEHWGRLLR